jgi:tetratricopeptide (TPR) repeat protein
MAREYRLTLALWALTVSAAAPAVEELTPAERLIEAGHWKRARALVEDRLRGRPDDALSTFLLSQIRNAFGDQKTPLPLAEKAVALDPATAKYHRQLAEVLGVTAQHANVLQQLFLARRFKKEIDLALELDPANVQAHRDLMEFYLLAPGIAGGDKDRARETAAAIARIDPAEGLLALARLAAADKQPGRIEGLLRQAVEVRPASYRARMALADHLLHADRPNLDEAERQARAAIAIDSSRVTAYEVLAQVYARRGQWSELDGILEAADREVPDDLTPHYRAWEALKATGQDPARAEREIGRYRSIEPEGNQPR